MTTTIIINIKTTNSSIISLIEISNLTKFVISINSKKLTSQIITSTRRRSTSARMRKWRMKKTIIVLSVINWDIIIEIVQKNINEVKQRWSEWQHSIQKMTKLRKRLNSEAKKINKSKELDLNKGMSSIPERKRLINGTCRFRNKN